MIKILTTKKIFQGKETSRFSQVFLEGLQGLSKEHSIGLMLDNSPQSIFLLLASLVSGKRIALCPPKEPPKIIESWLSSLGICELFTLQAHSLREINCRVYEEKDMVKNYSPARFSPASFSTIMRTSGTSAGAKSVVHSAKAHCASAQSVNNYFNFTASSCWLLSLPLHHVSGFSIVLRALMAGAGIGLARNHEELLFMIRSNNITHLSLVPAQVKRLLDEKEDLSHLLAVIIGGDALGNEEREEALRRKWPLYESYGLTESASMVWVKNSTTNIASILPHSVISLDEDGEILVKGKSMFAGYLEQGGLSCPFTKEGFFKTGDVGELNHTQLHITGRKSNRIISGGENIQVEEIEEAVELHPQVHMCVVVGLKHERYGERPIAFIKWKHEELPFIEIEQWLEKRLASYKKPDRFLLWPSPISSLGKKPRALLRQYLRDAPQPTLKKILTLVS